MALIWFMVELCGPYRYGDNDDLHNRENSF